MTAHSEIGASSSKRWLTCPASVRLSRGVPPAPPGFAASEGTCAHTLAEWSFMNNCEPHKMIGSFMKDLVAEEEYRAEEDWDMNALEIEITSEMADAVKVYTDLIRKEAGKNEIEVETSFEMDWLHKGMYGTNDALFIKATKKYKDLYIYDYKHGRGFAVDVKDNSQLVYYALGAAYDPDAKKLEDFRNIIMTVVQPRAAHKDGPIRRWVLSRKELQGWIATFKGGAMATEDPNAKAVPTEEGCRWCNGRSNCLAIHNKTIEICQTEFSEDNPTGRLPEEISSNLSTIKGLTDAQLAKAVAAKPMIIGFLEECERITLDRLKNREKIKGLKLIRGNSKRFWTHESQTASCLTSMGFEPTKIETKTKSPAEMEKEIGAGAKGLLGDLVTIVEGSLKVAPESSNKKEVILDNPVEDFED